MMVGRYAGGFVVCVFLAASAAAEFRLLPDEIVLTRAGDAHALLLERIDEGKWAGQIRDGVKFESENPAVATVSASGIVTAVGNGEALITATHAGQRFAARVTVGGAERPSAPSFRNDVQPLLFKMGCSTGACHGAQSGKNGFKLSLRSFDHGWDYAALTRQANGRRVSLAAPSDSLILLKPTMSVPHEGGQRFEADSEPYRILKGWLDAGAPPASETDPVVTRLEVLPAAVTLGQDGEQQFIVRAHYDDGTYRDVTRWGKFATTNESVAEVDQQGRAKVTGSGSTAITVYYQSNVASAEISVPREEQVPAAVFARAPRHNYIDELALEKIESLQIAPSGGISDVAFMRRAYLDAMGILPTPAELFAFALDGAPDKRAKLIDRIFERSEFVDYWSYKWSDLFLLSSKNLSNTDELDAFYRFIRQSVAENKPWDEFAWEILTATGNTTENGAANYFVMHKDVIDLTETTSQAFLGMSVTCARCHNHPLEKWTQNDYYGMANLFSRVKLKNGPGAGTEVLAKPFGNVVHPRLGEPLAPKPLDGKVLAIDARNDRREHLAAWLTSPENPYFTRAIANRVWENFMGKGLVDPVDDLRLTNPPSNAKLLTALAEDLAAHDYDLRHLMKVIMTSAAYQRSSEPSDPSQPDDTYYSQYIVRRLPAEVILDGYAQVTQVPTDFPGYPKGYRALQLRDSRVASYFLEAFGRPERNQTCTCERTDDANIAQTLHLANGDTLNEKLQAEGAIIKWYVDSGLSDDAILDDLFLRALGRYPTESQRERAIAALADVSSTGADRAAERRKALEDVAWALLSSKEFLFNH